MMKTGASSMFHTPQDAASYALAGNAIVTLKSRKTEQHFTYKIQARRNDDGKRDAPHASLFFVSVLRGPDNGNDYGYLGVMERKLEGLTFRTTKKSCLSDAAPATQAFRFFHKTVLCSHCLPGQLEVRHEGSCGRCGRLLTVPESVDRGIGPECASKMGML
jgi:hypothetical protein